MHLSSTNNSKNTVRRPLLPWIRWAWSQLLHPARRPAKRRLGLESLEDRAVPAIVNPLTIGGTTQATYTDANGDIVTVRIAGTTGTANFFDATNNPVDDGDDIGSVALTGVSPDFTLTYSVNAAGGDGMVAMGNITADRVLRGIYTVPDSTTASTFQLDSFQGVNFSAGGGLAVDTILGDANDLGLLLRGGLARGSTISIRGILDADLFFGDGPLDRTDGDVLMGALTPLTSHIEFRGPVGSTFSLLQQQGYLGTLRADGLFNGAVVVDGSVTEPWNFNAGVGALASFQASEWDEVNVTGSFAGRLASDGSEVELNVSGSLLPSAKINSDGQITLVVGGSVLRGATALADQGITFDIGGNMSGTFVAGSFELTGTITGTVTGAILMSSGDATVTVGGGVVRSTIAADNDLDLDVTGPIALSTISSGHSQISLAVTGNVTGSRFNGEMTASIITGNVSRSLFLATNFDDISLTVTGNLFASRFSTDDEVSVDVGGSVTSSSFLSTTGDVTLSVGTDLLLSTLISADDQIILDVGRDALGNRLLADDNNSTVTIGRNFRGLFQGGSADLVMTVGGSVLPGSAFLDGDTFTFDVTGSFTGTVVGTSLDFQVGGNVGIVTRLLVRNVQDLGADVDTVGFSVGGIFAGVLRAVDFDPNSDPTAGQTHVLVGGDVATTGRFIIQDIASTSQDDTYRFGGNFLGQLIIGGALDVDIEFAGNVNRVVIGGPVQDTITVAGRLIFLSAGGSLFAVTTPGFDGNFVDGQNIVTGNLDTTGGFVRVIPLF